MGRINLHFVFVPDTEEGEFITVDFARQLERELAEARELNAMMRENMQQMKAKYGLGGRNVMRELLKDLAEAREQLELERTRLAAVGVVACADTESSRVEARKMLPEYRSASLDDVERRVDECIHLRKERDDLIATLTDAYEGNHGWGVRAFQLLKDNYAKALAAVKGCTP
jgi:hypothetical protein